MKFNPFSVWGESTRQLHDRFICELNNGPGEKLTLPSAMFIGALISLEMACCRMGRRLRRLEQHDPKAFDALVRAMEKGND